MYYKKHILIKFPQSDIFIGLFCDASLLLKDGATLTSKSLGLVRFVFPLLEKKRMYLIYQKWQFYIQLNDIVLLAHSFWFCPNLYDFRSNIFELPSSAYRINMTFVNLTMIYSVNLPFYLFIFISIFFSYCELTDL